MIEWNEKEQCDICSNCGQAFMMNDTGATWGHKLEDCFAFINKRLEAVEKKLGMELDK